MKKNRLKRGIVLLVTIMLILLLMGIVSVFLKNSHKTQKSVSYISALNETSFLSYSLLEYLKTLKIKEKSLFDVSDIPIPLSIEKNDFLLTLVSAQNKIDLYRYISLMEKNSLYFSLFASYLQDKGLRNPTLFYTLLKNSKDKNMDEIFDVYFLKTSDSAIYDLPLSDVFSYDDQTSQLPADINFLNYEQLHFLLSDANTYLLKKIDKHQKLYKTLKELPFDKMYMQQLGKKHILQMFTTKTSVVKLNISIKNARFKADVVVDYDLGKRVALGYSIKDIELY